MSKIDPFSNFEQPNMQMDQNPKFSNQNPGHEMRSIFRSDHFYTLDNPMDMHQINTNNHK